MGCNCGNKTEKVFVHTNHAGVQQTHPTLISARAAQIRDKNAGKSPGSIREEVKK